MVATALCYANNTANVRGNNVRDTYQHTFYLTRFLVLLIFIVIHRKGLLNQPSIYNLDIHNCNTQIKNSVHCILQCFLT